MSSKERQIYYKLIALWVLCEAMLGGIIHGFKLPISGLIIGGSAVICISLIGYFIPHKGAILKATLVVAIFKMLLSPQSPFPAYIAVLFQGICGELIFSGKKNFKLRCYLLAFLALLESAVQRVLVMTILFGVDFWKAVNEFVSNLTKSDHVTNFSLYFVTIYLLLHLIAAYLIGRFTASIPKLSQLTDEESKPYLISYDIPNDEEPAFSKRRRPKFLLIIWLSLIGIFIYSYFYPESLFSNAHSSLKFIFRSSIILLSWYLIIGPLALHLMKSWLKKKETTYKKEISDILLLLPDSKALLKASWTNSSSSKGLARIKLFWKFVIINTFKAEEQ